MALVGGLLTPAFANAFPCDGSEYQVYDRLDGAGNRKALCISYVKLQQARRWLPETGEPPVSAARVIDIALTFSRRHTFADAIASGAVQNLRLHSIQLTPAKCKDESDEECYFYLVEIWQYEDGQPVLGGGEDLAILMDRTIIQGVHVGGNELRRRR